MPLGDKWWMRPSMQQLTGPQPAPRPDGPALGEGVPFVPFQPPPPWAGRWTPDEAELRTWGGAELLFQGPTADKVEHPPLRLVQARFPVPLPVLISIGATDPGGAAPWAGGLQVTFRVQIGVSTGQHIFTMAKTAAPASGVFTQSTTLAARQVTIDAFFDDATLVATSARVWAGIAIFG